MATADTSIAKHWIDGQWADSGEHRESVNPATGEAIGSYAMAGLKEAQAAMGASDLTAIAYRGYFKGEEIVAAKRRA